MEKQVMNKDNTDGLKFFGKVNASISHELKNILAIISETAGFLNDLTQLSKQGKPLDIELLENCSNSISEEIERGFETIRSMNKFSHSVDEPVKETDMAESLALAAKLTKFLSIARPVDITQPSDRVTIATFPFLVLKLLYNTLCFLYDLTEEGGIEVGFDSSKTTDACLVFSCSCRQLPDSARIQDLKKTAALLGGDITATSDPFELKIRIPNNN